MRAVVGTSSDIAYQSYLQRQPSPMSVKAMRSHVPTRRSRQLWILFLLGHAYSLRALTPHSKANTHSKKPMFQHALAILTMPNNSVDRIINEAILEKALPSAHKLSVVLRCQGTNKRSGTSTSPSLATLRRYVGEVYSQMWDLAMHSPQLLAQQQSQQQQSLDESSRNAASPTDFFILPDVVVYPQNLPNAAPESWIHIQKDLDLVCSVDSMAGWISTQATGRGERYQRMHGDGLGGLDEHVQAMNSERAFRNLAPVQILHVNPSDCMTNAVVDPNVVFLDDDEETERLPKVQQQHRKGQFKSMDQGVACNGGADDDEECDLILGGARITQGRLFDSVAVGGTFDGLHFGHRKLLTLAMSSVHPVTGLLLVGVTVDDMLRRKRFAEYIPSLQARMEGVQDFLHRLAPGMKNNIRIVPIRDAFGPPGQPGWHFDALVLSHETLETGYALNEHRIEQGMHPLTLLCTRRTEAHGMSSTALRRRRSLQTSATASSAPTRNAAVLRQQQQQQPTRDQNNTSAAAGSSNGAKSHPHSTSVNGHDSAGRRSANPL